jgi:hypothetical protein
MYANGVGVKALFALQPLSDLLCILILPICQQSCIYREAQYPAQQHLVIIAWFQKLSAQLEKSQFSQGFTDADMRGNAWHYNQEPTMTQ